MFLIKKGQCNWEIALVTAGLCFWNSIECEIIFTFHLQTSTSVLYVNWETFQDVEEFQTISHASGIQNYQLGIGKILLLKKELMEKVIT